MAQTIEIEADRLYPGDIIRFDYEIVLNNATIVGLAVKNVKETIASDDRLDYQGSDRVTMGDVELGRDVEILRIYAKVRRYRRAERPELQLAVAWVSVGAVVGLVAGAVVAWSIAMKSRGHVIQRIATDPDISDETKQKAIDAITGGPGIGAGLSTLGGSLVTVGIVLALLWGLSWTGRGRGGYE
jgi:hypothetical protein